MSRISYIFLMLILFGSYDLIAAENNTVASKVVKAVNDKGNSDAWQQGVGDIAKGVGKFGNEFAEQMKGYAKTHSNMKDGFEKLAANGEMISSAGNAIRISAKGAPYVGEGAKATGYFYEGHYMAATMKAANGAARTYTVAVAGTTAAGATGLAIDIWAAGELAAIGGSVGGPAVMVPAFVAGVLAAYVTGKVWDKTIGAVTDAAIQKDLDIKAYLKYAGKQVYIEKEEPYWKNPSNGPGGLVEKPKETKQTDNKISTIDIKEYFKKRDEEFRKEIADKLKEYKAQMKKEELAKKEKAQKAKLEQAKKRAEAEAKAARKRRKERKEQIKKEELSKKAKMLIEKANEEDVKDMVERLKEKRARDRYENLSTKEKHEALIHGDDDAWEGLKGDVEKYLETGDTHHLDALNSTKKKKKHKTVSKIHKKKKKHTARKRSHKKHHRKRSHRHAKRKSRKVRNRETMESVIGIIRAVGEIRNATHHNSHRKTRRHRPPRKKRHYRKPSGGGKSVRTVGCTI